MGFARGEVGTITDCAAVRPLDGSYVGDFAVQVFNAFHDQIPEQTSIPNFLLEIGELRQLLNFKEKWEALVDLVESQKNGRGAWKGDHSWATNRRRIKSVGDILSAFRNGFLEWSFGIKPLINDLNAIVTVSKKVEARLEYLRRVNGRSRKIKTSRSIDWPADKYITVTSSSYGGTPGLFIDLRPLSEGRISLHASTMVISNLRGLDEASARWKGIMNALGFDNAAKVVWNAIPYSFVVEYFLSVKGFLDRLEAQPFEGTYDFFNTCWSVTEYTSVEAKLRYNFSPREADREGVHITTYTCKHYTRYPGMPGGDMSLLISSPSESQRWLLAALLDQKVRK
jgi:hypothetical protein